VEEFLQREFLGKNSFFALLGSDMTAVGVKL